jgi:pimeloyl-ACP methyl ester carboxylesterase
MTPDDRVDVTTHEGVLPDGTKHRTQIPGDWNGTLLLYSYGPPSPPEAPAWPAGQPLVGAFLRRGYAIAGCGTTVFWPLEQNLPNQIAVLDLFEQSVGRPQQTIAWGQSIGGLMTASLVQVSPERLDGALVLCGTLGGGVGTHNQQLDCLFTFKTLLAPDSDLDLVNIATPGRNAELGLAILDEAQTTPEGYLQGALRRLHAAIEAAPSEASTSLEEALQHMFHDMSDPECRHTADGTMMGCRDEARDGARHPAMQPFAEAILRAAKASEDGS